MRRPCTASRFSFLVDELFGEACRPLPGTRHQDRKGGVVTDPHRGTCPCSPNLTEFPGHPRTRATGALAEQGLTVVLGAVLGKLKELSYN